MVQDQTLIDNGAEKTSGPDIDAPTPFTKSSTLEGTLLRAYIIHSIKSMSSVLASKLKREELLERLASSASRGYLPDFDSY